MKIVLKLFVFAFLVTLLTIGCKKILSDDYSNKIESTKDFDALFVKHWYYRTFENTSEWKSSWSEGKKYPSWKKGTYRKVGNLEIMEFPLFNEKTKRLIPSSNSLSSVEIKKVFSSSITRILFIRNAKNEIIVRIVDYIPNLEYLKEKKYDISDVEYGKIGDSFTGDMMVKDWNGNIKTMRLLANGKITHKIDHNKASSAKSKGSIVNVSSLTENCSWVTYCMMYEDCVVIGDVMTDDCGEPYPDLNDCYDEYVCTGGGNEDPCETYGIGCDDGGGGGDPPEEPVAASFIYKNIFAVKLSGSSGTNENWNLERRVTINGMKFINNPADNYYTTFVEGSDCYYNNYNSAYGGYNGNPNSLVYCYSQSGCVTNFSLIENDKKFTNTSSAIVFYPNYHAPNSPVTPFWDSYSNTKISNAEADL